MENRKTSFIASVADLHGQQLVRFFTSRVRSSTDAQDLAQEVYLRLLRLERPELIRKPEAYLFTVAANIIRENALRSSTRPLHVALEDISEFDLPTDGGSSGNGLEEAVQQECRIKELEGLLAGLSPKARAALIWHRRDGRSYKEIATRLGISVNMVKKYLVRAVAYCRSAMTASEAADE